VSVQYGVFHLFVTQLTSVSSLKANYLRCIAQRMLCEMNAVHSVTPEKLLLFHAFHSIINHYFRL
jgi:hypothetical protein